jgi:hypothetical protein
MPILPNDIKRFHVGQITANGTSEVTLTVPNLAADSIVIVSANTIAGTPADVFVSTKTAGASGTLGFKSLASNTGVYDVFVIS